MMPSDLPPEVDDGPAGQARRGTRAPGRPRDERADSAIVQAALDVLGDVGPTGLSVEAVATRAGVSKATIYRRFQCKDDLMVAALASLNANLPGAAADTSTRDALVGMLSAWWDQHETSTTGRLFPRVFAHARSNRRMFCSFYDHVIEPRREQFRTVLRRGVSRGELRPDTDIELVTTMLVSSTLYTLQVRAGGRDAAPGAGPEDFVDAVLAGVLAP